MQQCNSVQVADPPGQFYPHPFLIWGSHLSSDHSPLECLVQHLTSAKYKWPITKVLVLQYYLYLHKITSRTGQESKVNVSGSPRKIGAVFHEQDRIRQYISRPLPSAHPPTNCVIIGHPMTIWSSITTGWSFPIHFGVDRPWSRN